MSLRYYPSSRIKTDLITSGNDFFLNGAPYSGKYYETFDGKYFTGPNPALGKNEQLTKIKFNAAIDAISINAPLSVKNALLAKSGIGNVSIRGGIANEKPISYTPQPSAEDYSRGYITRYFIKRINDNGYIIEISPNEAAMVKNGTVNYDTSFYRWGEMVWRLVGRLETVRLSQWDIRQGILETNRRNTEKLNETFLGILDYIGGEYSKWSRPTK